MFAPAAAAYPLDKARIRRERRTSHIASGLRRIDITVNIKGAFGIGIENKPWAEEQDRQLSDYHNQLDREFKNQFVLIYLSRSEASPTTLPLADLETLRSEGGFGHITYWGG